MNDHQETDENPGPPLPKWAYTVVNPAMMAVLRSPLHGAISHSLMILIYQGRKSGKRYMIPVGYFAEGNHLYLFSFAAWAKNFIGGAPVAVRLRGKLLHGTARVTEDRALINKIVQRLIAERGDQMAQRMGFVRVAPDGSSQPRVPKSMRFIEIELKEP